MTNRSRVGSLIAGVLVLGPVSLGSVPVAAQAPAQPATARSYECAANAHCAVYCSVDGDKLISTGAPKAVTVTAIAPNNYEVEVVEQDGRAQFVYMAGAKVVCSLEGLTAKDR
jgi:hypothetical protein